MWYRINTGREESGNAQASSRELTQHKQGRGQEVEWCSIVPQARLPNPSKTPMHVRGCHPPLRSTVPVLSSRTARRPLHLRELCGGGGGRRRAYPTRDSTHSFPPCHELSLCLRVHAGCVSSGRSEGEGGGEGGRKCGSAVTTKDSNISAHPPGAPRRSPSPLPSVRSCEPTRSSVPPSPESLPPSHARAPWQPACARGKTPATPS